MVILIQEALDADIPRACEMEVAAYATNPANSVLFPGPFPPDSREQRVKQIVEMRENDSTAKLLKAVDEETGEQIAFAKWHIYETTEAVKTAPTRPLRFGQGTNIEACEAFFGGLVKKKGEIMGTKPHLYLHMLHTDPKHKGRGAGSALLKWGTEKADELGLPVYLESSPDGHRLYQKHGFIDVDTLSLTFSQPSGDDKELYAPVMIKEPRELRA